MTAVSLTDLSDLITPARLEAALRASFLVLVALPLALVAERVVRRWMVRKFSAQRALVVSKMIRYTGVSLVVLLVFRELGFSLAPLLGAAGIVGVALAFASQTSVSNIISGLFLIAENPFSVGDLIEVDGTQGIVISIDTLSVKLRTLDNRYVRLPNEMLIKAALINFNKFPIRRIDIHLGVAYRSDLREVRRVLTEVASRNRICLMEPKPLIVITGFGDSAIQFHYGVWVTQANFMELKNSIQEGIKKAFDAAGIEMPFPQRVVNWSSGPPASEPAPRSEEPVHADGAHDETTPDRGVAPR
jgi:small-conductance mechanosensitive channel